MGIQKDAGEMLALIHKNYIEKNHGLNDKEFVEVTNGIMID